MAIKNENEITVKSIVPKDNLVQHLIDNAFIKDHSFLLDDYHYIPKDLIANKNNIREVLKKAIIIRKVDEENKCFKKLTFKIKDFDHEGNIISQKAYNLKIQDIEDAKLFLNAIGYKELMHIMEYNDVYRKGDFEISIKDIVNGDLLMEIEANQSYQSIDELIKYINDIKLPIANDSYFIKKAEEYFKIRN